MNIPIRCLDKDHTVCHATHTTTQMNLKCIVLNERSQTKKATYCLILFMAYWKRWNFGKQIHDSQEWRGEFVVWELFYIITVEIQLFVFIQTPKTVYNKEWLFLCTVLANRWGKGTPSRNTAIRNECYYITNNYHNHIEGPGNKRTSLSNIEKQYFDWLQ